MERPQGRWNHVAQDPQPERAEPTERESRISPIDAHVGSRIRLRRTLMGMSQEKLGEALGLTFQQIQKYERGVNRVGASRLFDLSRVLEVPIAYFFDNIPDRSFTGATGLDVKPKGFSEGADALEGRASAESQADELVQLFRGLDDASVRTRFLDLLRAVSEARRPGAR